MLALKPMSSELKRYYKSLSCRHGLEEDMRFSLSRSILRTLENSAVFHYELHILQYFNVAQRISTHRNNIRIRPRRKHSDLSFSVEHDGRPRGCALNGIHRLHAKFRHARELRSDRRSE